MADVTAGPSKQLKLSSKNVSRKGKYAVQLHYPPQKPTTIDLPSQMPKPVKHFQRGLLIADYSFDRRDHLANPATPNHILQERFEAKEPLCYPCPPPKMFAQKNGKQSVSFLSRWLIIRPTILRNVALKLNEDDSLTTQGWRNVLSGNINSLESENNDKHTVINNLRGQLKEAFERGWMPIFENIACKPVRLEEEGLVKMIIWELSEFTFRHELMKLDELLVDTSGWSDIDWAARQELYRSCWGSNFVKPSWDDPEGLAAQTSSQRAPYYDALCNIMKNWPRFPQQLTKWPIVGRNDLDCEDAQKDAAAFYCQTFIDYFGRYPVLPCGRPSQVSP
ncbi:MAG: hypothetical protein ACREHG_02740 [Candidatus Saccharimonadales bacterium]